MMFKKQKQSLSCQPLLLLHEKQKCPWVTGIKQEFLRACQHETALEQALGIISEDGRG